LDFIDTLSAPAEKRERLIFLKQCERPELFTKRFNAYVRRLADSKKPDSAILLKRNNYCPVERFSAFFVEIVAYMHESSP